MANFRSLVTWSTTHANWNEFYPYAEEEIPKGLPEPKGKPVKITVYVDADHAHDQVTKKTVTGIILFLNNMHF